MCYPPTVAFATTEFGWRSELCYPEAIETHQGSNHPEGFTLKPDDAGDGISSHS